jgi:hypothetical protein
VPTGIKTRIGKGIVAALEVARGCECDLGFHWLIRLDEANYYTLADFHVKKDPDE